MHVFMCGRSPKMALGRPIQSPTLTLLVSRHSPCSLGYPSSSIFSFPPSIPPSSVPPSPCFCSSPGHQEKPNILCFHPLASSILASCGYDCRLYIWNVNTKKIAITLNPVKEPVSNCYIVGLVLILLLISILTFLGSFQLFSMAWSPCGQYLATISKDHSIRIYEPRASCGPIKV